MKKFYVAEYTFANREGDDYDNEKVEKGVIGLFSNFDAAKKYARKFYENVGDDYPAEYTNESITTTEYKNGNNEITTWHTYSCGETHVTEEIRIYSIDVNNNANPYEDIIGFHVG